MAKTCFGRLDNLSWEVAGILGGKASLSAVVRAK